VTFGGRVVDDEQLIVWRPVDGVDVSDEFVHIDVEFELSLRIDELVAGEV
jgi:hypothetical protein